jgi:CDP-diacylglycerol--serine O-phosphatidyltransferase
LVAAIVHFAPTPIRYAHRFEVLAIMMMVLIGFLSLLMVSTIRFTSFKSVGAGRRLSPRLVIGFIALAGLIYLYSQWVLLSLVVAYIVHGLLSRGLAPLFRRSAEAQSGEVHEL